MFILNSSYYSALMMGKHRTPNTIFSTKNKESSMRLLNKYVEQMQSLTRSSNKNIIIIFVSNVRRTGKGTIPCLGRRRRNKPDNIEYMHLLDNPQGRFFSGGILLFDPPKPFFSCILMCQKW
jgi:hypothetical protein